MKIWNLLFLLFFSSALCSQNNQPNIIFILVDDMGYGDLGHLYQDHKSGPNFDTPFLDEMALDGMVLTDHYTTPLCAPSRSSFLQGLTSGHATARDNFFDFPLPNDLSVPKMLQFAGYKTFMVGKHGLAGSENSNWPGHPLRRGFDDFFGYLDHVAAHEHYPRNGTTEKKAFVYEGFQKITSGTEKTYTTDLFTARAKKNIIDHKTDNPDQPFFLYLAYDVPHQKMQIPTSKYPAGKGLNGGIKWTGPNSTTPFVNTAFGTIDSWHYPEVLNQNWPETEKKHVTMMRRLDECVGDLIQTLKDLNIDNNTLVVFTSDNGPHTSEGHRADFFESYGQFRGQKSDITDGGIRVPVIARWPETIDKSSKSDHPCGIWNWGATFAEVANQPIPARMDGASLLNVLKGGSIENDLPPYIEFWDPLSSRLNMQAIRKGKHIGIRQKINHHHNPLEIYDLKTDPKQLSNIANSLPELEKELKAQMLKMRVPNPLRSRPYDIALIPSAEEVPTENGLNFSKVEGDFNYLPKVESFKEKQTGELEYFDLPSNSSQDHCILYEGYLLAPTSGKYTFYLKSKTPAHLMLHDIHVTGGDVNHTPSQTFQDIYLESGYHPLRLYLNKTVLTDDEIDIQFKGPGLLKQKIPQSLIFKKSSINPNAIAHESFPDPITPPVNIIHKSTGLKLFNSFDGQITEPIDQSQNEDLINWTIKDAGTNDGYFYLINIGNGRKLTSEGNFTKITTASPTTTNENMLWKCESEFGDEDWFTLYHKTSQKVLHLAADGTSLFTLGSRAWNSANTRWRFQESIISSNNIEAPINLVHKSSSRIIAADNNGKNIKSNSSQEIGTQFEWQIQKSIGNYFYLIHKASGRKLGPSLDLKSMASFDPILHGDHILWSWENIPNDPEWFRLKNKATGRWLHLGSDGIFKFQLGPTDWSGDNTRWKTQKPNTFLGSQSINISNKIEGRLLYSDIFGRRVSTAPSNVSGKLVEWGTLQVDDTYFYLIHGPNGKKLYNGNGANALSLSSHSVTGNQVLWSWESIPEDPSWYRIKHKGSRKYLHKINSNGVQLTEKENLDEGSKWQPKLPGAETNRDLVNIFHKATNKKLFSNFSGEFGVTDLGIRNMETDWIIETTNDEYFYLINSSTKERLFSDGNFTTIKSTSSNFLNNNYLWKWEPIPGDREWFRLTHKASNLWLHIDDDGYSKFTLGPRTWTGSRTKWKPEFLSLKNRNFSATQIVEKQELGLGDIFIFPNPTTRVLNVKFRSQPHKIQIFNLIGKEMKSFEISKATANDWEINLEKFPNGLYYLTSIQKDKSIISKTFQVIN